MSKTQKQSQRLQQNTEQDDIAEDIHVPPNKQEHLLLVELSNYPPLTGKKVRRRYRELVKAWRHDTARHRYGQLIGEALKYCDLSQRDPANAHIFYFQRNKDAKPDDFLY